MCRKLVYCLCSFVLLLSLVLGSAAHAALPGLIGWYKLDEGSGTIVNDSSGLGNHGFFGPEGDPQWVVGIRGGALDLDGNDDYVNVNSLVDDIAAVRDISVAAWIKTTQTGDGNVIGGNHGNSHDFIFGVINGNVLSESDTLNEYPPKVNDDQWHHIAYVRDGTTAAYIYTDGVLVGTETPSGEPWLEDAWSIGQEYDPNPSDEFDGIVDDVQFYNRPLSAAEVVLVMVGVPPGAASNPSPENEETDVFRDTDLSWMPGEFAPAVNGHRVHLSESFNDVNDGLGAVTQSAAVYDPGRLNLGTTYFWRVDEVNAPPDSSVHKGEVWSFTTEPLAYPISGANIIATASSSGQANLGPENTVNGSGDLHTVEPTDMWLSANEPLGAWIQYELDKVYQLHEMWVWNSNQVFEPLFGFGMKDVTVEYSANGTDWTALAGVPEFTKAPGTAGYAHDTTVDFRLGMHTIRRLTLAACRQSTSS
ncbi:MAG: LamG-like jellyroll fold domain-containing protein [Planctomycetota bacterium]